MALETLPWDTAEFLTSPESIFYYLEAELADNEMPYLARCVGTVIRARGGVDVVATETGVASSALEQASAEVGDGDRDTVMKMMEAYRLRMGSESRVA